MVFCSDDGYCRFNACLFNLKSKEMNNILRFLLVLIPIALVTFFYLYINDDDYYPGADFRKFNLPSFELSTLYTESKITEEDIEGSYLINIWASWCITCRIEHDFLSKLSNQDIPIVGLNYKDEREDAINWIERFGDPYKIIIHDFKGKLALDMGVTGAPETFLVHDGRIVVHYRGEVNKMIWSDVFEPVIKEKGIFQND